MTKENLQETRFSGAHDSCPLSVPHNHALKRAIGGYVLGQVDFTEQVAHELVSMLKAESVEKKHFAAKNLRGMRTKWIYDALLAALNQESDAITAGLLILALGNQQRREAVEHINKWVARADEASIAQNIMTSYLQLWTDTGCSHSRRNSVCEKMQKAVATFVNSSNFMVVQEARRLVSIMAWEEQKD
jgi:hypothetical protein